MREYYSLEKSLQVILENATVLSVAQRERISQILGAILLAGKSHLRWVARQLPKVTQQGSRTRWVSRTLAQPYVSQSHLYQPLVKRALVGYHAPVWHLVMDRSTLGKTGKDLVSLNLNFRGRAIPLVWSVMSNGMSGFTLQQRLIKQVQGLIPPQQAVVFHGDNEFGSIATLRYVHGLGWHFILGQSAKNRYRVHDEAPWQTLGDLPVTRQQPIYLQGIELTKHHAYGPVNLYAFYKPKFDKGSRKQDIRYCATSLPSVPATRRIGQRRWSIECSFKDLKSSGWQLHLTHLQHPDRLEGLLTLLNCGYLWAICLGRWLCKTGRRAEVDDSPHRQLSLFRLGWDWIVHRSRCNASIPPFLTLYQ